MKLKSLSLIIIFLLLSTKIAFASNDILVTCTAKDCKSNSTKPFFSVENLVPGDTVSQKIIINNTRKDECDLSFFNFDNTETNEISEQLIINITDDKTTYYENLSLKQFFNSKSLRPIHISSKERKELLWTIQLHTDTNNSYQGSKLNFNFEMAFVCGNDLNILSPKFSDPQVLGTQTANEEVRNLIQPFYKNTQNEYWGMLLLLQLLIQYFLSKLSLQYIVSIGFLILFLMLNLIPIALISFFIGVYFTQKSSK